MTRTVLESGRLSFPSISSRAWEHPADRAALTALRKVPGFDTVLRKVAGFGIERRLRLFALANGVRVSPQQHKRVWDIHREACAVLDVKDPPEVFVVQNPFINASAVGIDKPFIMMRTSTLDLFDDDELLAIMGHELGHVVSGHVLYANVLQVLLMLLTRITPFFMVSGVMFGVVLALLEWYRKAELSCDRAGLLCVQNVAVAVRTDMKLVGGTKAAQMSVEEFLKQADEYRNSGSVMDSIAKIMNLIWATHPFAVLRVAEIKEWGEGDEYKKILAGEYARREDDPKDDFRDRFREAAASYREAAEASKDPLINFVKSFSDIGAVGRSAGRAAAAGAEATDALSTIFDRVAQTVSDIASRTREIIDEEREKSKTKPQPEPRVDDGHKDGGSGGGAADA